MRLAKRFNAEFSWFEEFAKMQIHLIRGTDLREALAICEKLIRKYPTNSEILTYKAMILV
jgi:hypothetical protein